MTTHKGSCHCGKITYTFEGDIKEALDCNCSLCARRGGLLHFVPDAAFTLATARDDLSTYQFYKHVLSHHFCDACGIAPFSEGTDPKGNKMIAVNLRCVEGIDLAALNVRHYNGRDA